MDCTPRGAARPYHRSQRRWRTTLVIAHPMATVCRVDRIAQLDEGRVVATGRHEELYGRSELYRRLCDLRLVQSVAEG